MTIEEFEHKNSSVVVLWQKVYIPLLVSTTLANFYNDQFAIMQGSS